MWPPATQAVRCGPYWQGAQDRGKIECHWVRSFAVNSLTIKLPSGLDAALADASLRAQITKSELVRRAVTAYLVPGGAQDGGTLPPSALALAGDLVGCFGGGPIDLSSNPGHLDGFGQQ